MGRGDNPNSRANLSLAYGGKGGFDTETARKAKEKSDEAKAINASLSADLKGRCTPERLAKINEKVLAMAEKGNLKAYEIVRDTIGEKPTDKVTVAVSDQTLDELNEYFSRQESPNDIPATE